MLPSSRWLDGGLLPSYAQLLSFQPIVKCWGLSLTCHLWNGAKVQKSWSLLEWSFGFDQVRLPSVPDLCGCKLLGLGPDPLLVIHPVLTGMGKTPILHFNLTGSWKSSAHWNLNFIPMKLQNKSYEFTTRWMHTSKLCKPLLVLGLECWAHSAAPGFPTESENTCDSPELLETISPLPHPYAITTMKTCLMVMAGLQSLSSSRMDRQTVPDG